MPRKWALHETCPWLAARIIIPGGVAVYVQARDIPTRASFDPEAVSVEATFTILP